MNTTDADVQAAQARASTQPVLPAYSEIDHSDRDAFGLRLQQHFHQQAVNDVPFLLVALRTDALAPARLNFSLLYDAVRHLLRDQDDWLIDLHNKRLIVLLAQGCADDARRFFARLKVRLMETAPQWANEYLYAISAITVLNGTPFLSAEDFLTMALEDDE